jgi:hypothetical protein
MKREPVDPRIDTLMAALYGELSEAEDRAFRRLLETDEALRAEWEELQEGREILSGWRIDEAVPSCVIAAKEEKSPWWRGWTDRLRLTPTVPMWGLSLATVAALAFAFGQRSTASDVDARIERAVAQQMESVKATLAASQSTVRPETLLGEGPALELARRGDPSGSVITPATADRFLTKDEFASENTELMTTLADLLNRHEARRESDVAGLVESLYTRVSSQQLYDYRELKNRIDALGVELALERRRVDHDLGELIGPNGRPQGEAERGERE